MHVREIPLYLGCQVEEGGALQLAFFFMPVLLVLGWDVYRDFRLHERTSLLSTLHPAQGPARPCLPPKVLDTLKVEGAGLCIRCDVVQWHDLVK